MQKSTNQAYAVGLLFSGLIKYMVSSSDSDMIEVDISFFNAVYADIVIYCYEFLSTYLLLVFLLTDEVDLLEAIP